MDLTYPAEAETFRAEVRSWLTENLPDGWFHANGERDHDFSLSGEDREQFNKAWTVKLFEGGWICSSWPDRIRRQGTVDHGGRCRRRRVRQGWCADARRLLRRHVGWPHDSAVGHRSAEEAVPPRNSRRLDLVVSGVQRARVWFRSCRHCSARPNSTEKSGSSTARRCGRPRRRVPTIASC